VSRGGPEGVQIVSRGGPEGIIVEIKIVSRGGPEGSILQELPNECVRGGIYFRRDQSNVL
jgi:hypothetical protein